MQLRTWSVDSGVVRRDGPAVRAVSASREAVWRIAGKADGNVSIIIEEVFKMMNEPSPIRHLREVEARYSGIWHYCNETRALNREMWGAECYLPAEAFAEYVAHHTDIYLTEDPRVNGRLSVKDLMRRAVEASKLHVLASWRATKGIYSFDDLLLSALKRTPLNGVLPVALFRRFPQWCIYVKGNFSFRDVPLDGFYAHLRFWTGLDEPDFLEICMVPALGFGDMFPIRVPLTCKTIEGAIQERVAQSVLDGVTPSPETGIDIFSKDIAVSLRPLLSALLYLCSEEPDVANLKYPTERPSNPQPVRTRHGVKEFCASGVTNWNVGWRVGALLRKAEADTGERGAPNGEHLSPRPHVRAAHWHTYWTGKGRAEPRVKWLSPMLVNAEKADDLPAVVRRVGA